MSVNVNRCYKEYTGKLFFLVDVYSHAETTEMIVVYTDGENTSYLEYEKFFGPVEVEGEKVQRFTRINYTSNK